MEKTFDPKNIEAKWYSHWEDNGYFKPSGKGEPYSILLPPPNVTGTLHMGHAFQHTLQDCLIRYHRMLGFNTLWQMGTDHAGIATEMVVSRQLEAEGESRSELSRIEFVERVWQWKEQSGNTITRQMRRLGASGDWSRECFTMDPVLSNAVTEAFIRLYDEGLIYRGQRLVNWDPVLKTAISDLEVVSEEEDGFLWSILYPFVDPDLRAMDGNRGLIVATTRPETMLGDLAVAVHPEDERYQHLIGKMLTLPLCDRQIPIIADEYVEREFGTGCVKITPAHDKNDYAVWERHAEEIRDLINSAMWEKPEETKDIAHRWPKNWTLFSVLALDGTIATAGNNVSLLQSTKHTASQTYVVDWPGVFVDTLIPEKYQGLDRFVARKKIVLDLTEAGLLIGDPKPHKLQVPRGDRSGVVIEPMLTEQWFVKMDSLGKRGLELVEKGRIRFVPENWINTYRHWMTNIQDWCISRQLSWGHRIPAWYDEQGKIYIGKDEAEIRIKHGLSKDVRLKQDDDVLETWFSSALWPFSTLGWPGPTEMEKRSFDIFLPSSVLVTGFDIIFFWVARMIMMTDHFTGEIPFKDVYITGLVRDKDGQKMSKSKGNILDPIDLIDGIDLESLVTKRTSGLMQPQMKEKIEKATRKEFASGIPAFGADALRFTFASLATHGRDIKFDLERCNGYKSFCNKLWNAARFVLHWQKKEVHCPDNWPVTTEEKWILTRFSHCISEVRKQFAAYRFDLASQVLYEFTWNEFCDWFIELSKPHINDHESVNLANGAPYITMNAANIFSVEYTLLFVLEGLLRALHPLVPFVTEEIWHEIAPKLGITDDTISLQPYPKQEDFPADTAAENEIEWLKNVVTEIRKIRSEKNIAPSKQLSVLFKDGTTEDVVRTEKFDTQLRFLCRLDSCTWLASSDEVPASAAAVLGELKILIPLAGLIDASAEKTRLAREISKIEVEITKCENKLSNVNFVQSAPTMVVEQERGRLADFSTKLSGLRQQLEQLSAT